MGAMGVRIVLMFNSQRMYVEPEMGTLVQRWETVVSTMDGKQNFSLVEVEQIKTTNQPAGHPCSCS